MSQSSYFIGSAVAAATVVAVSAHAAPSPSAHATSSGKVKVKDGAELFVRDWGSGRPVIPSMPGHCLRIAGSSRQSRSSTRATASSPTIAAASAVPAAGESGYDYNTYADDLAEVIQRHWRQRHHAQRLLDGWRRNRSLPVPARQQEMIKAARRDSRARARQEQRQPE
jgi:hypothetical protein